MSRQAYSPLLRQVEERLFEVAEDMSVDIPEMGVRYWIPRGFRTDLASVPRFLCPVVPTYGRYSTAAVVHDFLYSKGGNEADRCQADWAFFLLMKQLGVRRWRRWIMFIAVRLFGWRAFRYN